MDLSSPLRTIAPSLDSAVLEVLARVTSPLSASAIARMSRRGTRAGQALVLARLVAHGLVATQPAAVGELYSLNRDHILASSVIEVVRSRAVLVERLRERLAEVGPVHASIFGSVARGDAGPDSDIDVLMIVGDGVDLAGASWEQWQEALETDTLRWSGNALQLLCHTETHISELTTAQASIVESWRHPSITLVGADAAEVLRLGPEAR